MSNKELVREAKRHPEYKIFRKKERIRFFIYAIIHILFSIALYVLFSQYLQHDAGAVFEFFFLSAVLLFFFGIASVFTTPVITTGTIENEKFNERKGQIEYRVIRSEEDIVRTYTVFGVTNDKLNPGDNVYVLDGAYIFRVKESSL